MDWSDQVEMFEDRSSDERKVARLLNAMSRLPGGTVEKREFLRDRIVQWEAMAVAEGVEPDRMGSYVLSKAISWWRYEMSKSEGTAPIRGARSAPLSADEREEARRRAAVAEIDGKVS